MKKTKQLTLEVKALKEDGTFEGYGSIFGNVDSYGDIVDKGAFRKTLQDRGSKVKLLWQHDSAQPIGVFTNLAEDDTGLRFQGQLNLDVQKGKEAYSLLKQGAIDGMSIGYIPVQAMQDSVDPSVQHLTEVKLYEISLVTFPANEEATVTSVKSAFDELSNAQKIKVLDFIKNINKEDSSLSIQEPPITEASVEKHSKEEKADTQQTSEPPVEEMDPDLKHSLEQLRKAFKSQ